MSVGQRQKLILPRPLSLAVWARFVLTLFPLVWLFSRSQVVNVGSVGSIQRKFQVIGCRVLLISSRLSTSGLTQPITMRSTILNRPFWTHTKGVRILPHEYALSGRAEQSLPGAYQQATSTLVTNNQSCYELSQGCFAVYGFQYQPGYALPSWLHSRGSLHILFPSSKVR